MMYNQFGFFHIMTLVCSILTPFLLWLILRNKKDLTKRIILGVFAFVGIGMLVYEFFRDGRILYDLPLHLCSLNGLLIPFVLIFKNKRLGNMLMLWSFGALGALIFNFEVDMLPISDPACWTYFVPHYVQLTIPLSMGLLKIFEIDYKTIPSTLLFTVIAYTIVHIINKIFAAVDPALATNYMFSVHHQNNVFLLFMWNICPYEYFYMFLMLPLILVLLIIIYFNQFIKIIISTNKRKKK